VNDLELKKIAVIASGVDFAKVSRVIDAYHAQVIKALKRGDLVYTGLGSYRVGKREARNGRNPRTGATIAIRAKNTPRFRPKQMLIDAVN
jgi:DNA-binding protein HU-beta